MRKTDLWIRIWISPNMRESFIVPMPFSTGAIILWNAYLRDKHNFWRRFGSQRDPLSCSSKKIRLPTFSGRYEDWCQFSDLFLGSVDKKSSLSNCQKFHYLKSYLDGEALSLIKHIPITDDNYQDAWERLKNRYNKKSLIARSFIQNFLSLPTAKSSNIIELRNIVDTADGSIRGLHALKCDSRDVWLIHILLSKLDPECKEAWATSSESCKENVTINDLFAFLFARFDALESCQELTVVHDSPKRRAVSHHVDVPTTSARGCVYCHGPHSLYVCTQFKAMNVVDRRTFAMEGKLCFNCLSRSHQVKDCNSTNTCRLCKSRHHTLVHPEEIRTTPSVAVNTSADPNLCSPMHAAEVDPAVVSHHTLERGVLATSQAILPTILATIVDSWGNETTCRILMDTGSTITMVSESFIQRIGLSRTHARIPVVGLGASPAGVTRGRATFTLLSRTSTTSVVVTGLIMSTLTSSIPAQRIESNTPMWGKIFELPLADPTFGTPGEIDLILGADQLWNIYTGERKEFGFAYPIALHTKFGWVITGSYHIGIDDYTHALAHHAHEGLDTLVRSFMDMDQVQPSSATIDASDPAEQHFVQTHSRRDDGVYVVRYPFKDSVRRWGSTLPQAIRRFLLSNGNFESFRHSNNNVDFMEDYLQRGHMELIPPTTLPEDLASHNYLAHHAVFKPDSTTTRCRVVFDGSGEDCKGYSLNSRLHIGPPIQRDLLGVCLRFRQHRYVFCTDIEKMFRGILVSEEHTQYQRIFWRRRRLLHLIITDF
ncbi:uncharacterized protein LOC121404463 [Drosophila obscura]|uniref:uncharacterized protein LOC121404463 n=1 Tax=Drosophila obscura TaxID=7282 RepID=UPI001BB1D30A|nr:uncharacterized protein LOC121404463 [Drosophila obscura]